MTETYRFNYIREEFFTDGFLDTNKFRLGESIDWANDCHLTDDGRHIVFRHNSFDARRSGNVKVGNSLRGAACDAITLWERHHNPSECDNDRNEETSLMMWGGY